MRVKCPSCKVPLTIEDRYAGMMASCPRCQNAMMLPPLPAGPLPAAEILPDDPPPRPRVPPSPRPAAPPPPTPWYVEPVSPPVRPAAPPPPATVPWYLEVPPPPVRIPPVQFVEPSPLPPGRIPPPPPPPSRPGTLFSTECPACHHQSRLRMDLLGRRAGCKQCGFKFVLQPDLDDYPPYACLASAKLEFPKLCVGCLAANPREYLDVRTEPEDAPAPPPAGGSTAGAIIGGIIGGILFGEAGAAIGAAAGGGGGAVAAHAANPAVNARMPICAACRDRLSEDDVTIFGERTRGMPRVRTAHVQRTWADGVITFRFAHKPFGEAFQELNPKAVNTPATQPLSVSSVVPDPPPPPPDEPSAPDESKLPKWKRKMGTAVGRGAPIIGAKPKATAAASSNGPKCPKCEFSYAWNGIRCGHCGHVA